MATPKQPRVLLRLKVVLKQNKNKNPKIKTNKTDKAPLLKKKKTSKNTYTAH